MIGAKKTSPKYVGVKINERENNQRQNERR